MIDLLGFLKEGEEIIDILFFGKEGSDETDDELIAFILPNLGLEFLDYP